MTATADANASFTSWTGDCAASANSMVAVTLDAAKTCAVTFTADGDTTTPPISGTGDTALTITAPVNGVIISEPVGINCGTNATECQFNYAQGTNVILTATADENASFEGWSGDCTSGTSSLTVVPMSAAKTCVATFTSTTGDTGTGSGPQEAIITVDGQVITDGSTAAIEVGSTTVGQPITKSITIKNTSATTMDLYGYRLPNGFSMKSIYPKALAAGEEFVAEVQLNTFEAGTPAGSIELYSSDGGSPFEFVMTGTVTGTTIPISDPPITDDPITNPTGGTPEIQVLDGQVDIIDGTSTSIDFGTTAPGALIEKTFTVRNVGNGDLNLDNLVTYQGSSGFNVNSYDVPKTLTVGQSATFIVTLNAMVEGNSVGTLTIESNDSDEGSFNFPISGSVSQQLAEEINCFNGNGIVSGGVCVNALDNYTLLNTSGMPSDAVIKGGASKYADGKYSTFTQKATLTTATAIMTAGIIKVDKKHVGKKADILAVGLHYNSGYPNGLQWYMLNGCSTCPKQWKLGMLATSEQTLTPILAKAELLPLTTIDSMPEYLSVDLYSGTIGTPGPLNIYWGYRVEEGDDLGIVIATDQGIELNITE